MIAWSDHEYVLGSDKQYESVAHLPQERWERIKLDALAMTEDVTTVTVENMYAFETPDSRAGLAHFRRIE